MAVLSAQVRHEDRECAIHGRTLHSQYYVGLSDTPRWYCLRCECARVKAYHARKAAGEPARERRAKAPQSRPAVCPCCFLALTTAGTCPDECTS